MYNINGSHYIWLTRPHAGQYILKSDTGPFGPYESRQVVGEIESPVHGAGCPHQGALIQTPNNQWFHMAFMDGFPAGRIPVLAPVTWTSHGWPEVHFDTSKIPGSWYRSFPMSGMSSDVVKPKTCFRTHSFLDKQLEPCWEWNHNPNNMKWDVTENGLILEAATVTDTLHLATNTLTHRSIGPRSSATFCLNTSGLVEGDRAGVCIFRDKSAYIGIHQMSEGARIVYVDDISIKAFNIPVGFSNGHPVALDWVVERRGSIKAETDLASSQVWLKVMVDVRPAFSHGFEGEPRLASFAYSYDGKNFTVLGPHFLLSNTADTFVGYRFAVFEFATKSLGGRLEVESCVIASW